MSMFDPDDDAPDSRSSSPFAEEVDSAPTPEPEDPSGTPLPPAGAQDSSGDYVSAPEGSLPTEEQGPTEGFRSPAETAPEASPDGAPTDDNDWLKPIPLPPGVKFSPYKDSTADLDALKAQYTKEAGENVKPSVLRRIVAGLGGGAAAFGSNNPGEGAAITREILNAPRERAEQRWQREEKPLAQQLASDQAENATIQRQNQVAQQQGTEADRQYRNQAYAQRQHGEAGKFVALAQAAKDAPMGFKPDDPSNPYAGGTITTANHRQIPNQQPYDKWIQAWTKTPQGQNAIESMSVDGRTQIAAQHGLKPGTEQYNNFVFKTPMTTHTTYSFHEGGTPKPAMSSAQQRLILNTKNGAMAKAQDQLAQGLIQPKDAQVLMQSAQDNFEEQLGVDTTGPDHVVVGPDFSFSKAGAQRQPQAQVAQPQQQSAAQPQTSQPQTFQFKGQTISVGQKATVAGKPVIITGMNPQTGKLITQAQ